MCTGSRIDIYLQDTRLPFFFLFLFVVFDCIEASVYYRVKKLSVKLLGFSFIYRIESKFSLV